MLPISSFAESTKRHVAGRIFLWVLLLVLTFLSTSSSLWAQVSSSFWFDVPEVTRGQVWGNDRKVNFYLHLAATKNQVTKVRLEMPAETGFAPKDFIIPADGKIKIGFTKHSTSGIVNDWFAVPQGWDGTHGDLSTVAQADWPKYIENVLYWSDTDIASIDAGKLPTYVNRTNKGVHIYAIDAAGNFTDKTPFKAYLEVACKLNRDLMVLKGEAAEGTEFTIPMQTDQFLSRASYFDMPCSPYRSFNITATENNTIVEITVKNPVWCNTRRFDHEGCPNNTRVWGYKLSAGKHYLYFEKAGQSSIITPYAQKFTAVNNNCEDAKVVKDPLMSYTNDIASGGRFLNKGIKKSYQTSRHARVTLEGSQVRSLPEVNGTKYSGGKIVITYQEQLLQGPDEDAVMDQLIPDDDAGKN